MNFQSCSRYEEGPGFSLRSVKSRLTGEWEVQEIEGYDDLDGEYIFEFEKDGDFEASYSYYGYSYSENGEWSFEDGKSSIELDWDDGGKEEFEIIRLTNKELWLEDEDGDQWEFEKE